MEMCLILGVPSSVAGGGVAMGSFALLRLPAHSVLSKSAWEGMEFCAQQMLLRSLSRSRNGSSRPGQGCSSEHSVGLTSRSCLSVAHSGIDSPTACQQKGRNERKYG